MVHYLSDYVILFFAYATLGWCMETLYMGVRERRITNRGFLLGPCCPIYGAGMVGITLLFQDSHYSYWHVFFSIILLCSLLEYAVSALMERVFHTRWWDYHDMRFNIHGRICLETMLPFGLLGTFALYRINPFLMMLYHRLPGFISGKLAVGLVVLLLADLVRYFKKQQLDAFLAEQNLWFRWGVLLALIAAKKRTMSVAYETLFAVTMAMSMSVSAMIFKLAYNPNIGILNYILGVKINWLNDKHYAMVAISIIATWMNVGYNFIFLLAAVRNIPQEILESCELDGARPFQRTVNIILPMISPTTFYLICTSLAKSMMMSGLVLIFTGGASLNTTANIDTMISYMYKQSVNNLNYNKGYAAAIIAFLMTFVVMLISFRFEKKGVHYS